MFRTVHLPGDEAAADGAVAASALYMAAFNERGPQNGALAEEELITNDHNQEIERCEKAATWLAEQAKDLFGRRKIQEERHTFWTGTAEEKLSDEDEQRLRNLALSKFGYEDSTPSSGNVQNTLQDPLLHWMSQMERMRKFGDEQGYFSIAKRCFLAFTSQPFLFPSYRSDPRFLRICISNAKMCTNPTDSPKRVFHDMYKLGIGTRHALFWVEWGIHEGADMDCLTGTEKDTYELDDKEIGIDQGITDKIPAAAASQSKRRHSLNEGHDVKAEFGINQEMAVDGSNFDAIYTGVEPKKLCNGDELEKAGLKGTKLDGHNHENLPLANPFKSEEPLGRMGDHVHEVGKEINSHLNAPHLDAGAASYFYLPPQSDGGKSQDFRWELQLKDLVAYTREHRHANVPHCYKQNPKLASWVTSQRAKYRQKELTPERIRRLHEVGFEFYPRKQGWDARYAELVEYTREHGNANVPLRYHINPVLGQWVHDQRKMFKKSRLSQERIDCFQKIGFQFSLREQPPAWDVTYAELVEYLREHGNTNVPRSFKGKASLGEWVHTQRTFFKQNKLSQERISGLCKLGFEFSLKDQPRWDARYADLVAYAREHRSTNVPQQYSQNPALGRWVHDQRTIFQQNKLSQERVSRLGKLGFEFCPYM